MLLTPEQRNELIADGWTPPSTQVDGNLDAVHEFTNGHCCPACGCKKYRKTEFSPVVACDACLAIFWE